MPNCLKTLRPDDRKRVIELAKLPESVIDAKDLTSAQKKELEKVARDILKQVDLAIDKIATDVEGKKPPVKPPKKKKQDEEEKAKKRKFAQQILSAEDISAEVKKGLSEDAKTYIPKGISITNAEAKAIVELKGAEQALADYLDRTNGITMDVRVILGEQLIKKFNQQEDYDNAIKVADNLAKLFTDLGRAVNAAKAFSLLTPEGMLRYVQREKTKQKDKYSRETSEPRKKAKSEVDKITKETFEKVISSPKVKGKIASEVKKGRIKKAIDFLEGLKIDTSGKALDITYGLTATLWNSLITTVQKGLEAGLTITQAINKAINKVKPQAPDFDEAGARSFLDEKLKDYRVALDPEKAIKEELKSQNEKIDKIVRKHYTEQQKTKESLVQKLVKDAGLTDPEATEIANELANEFDRLSREAKERALKKYLPKESGKKTGKRKELIDELIEASNLGALDEEFYRDKISEKLGPNPLTAEQAKKIKELSDAVQKAIPGFDQNRAIERLMNYVAHIDGVSWKDVGMAIWYANILSGLSTQVLNISANMAETLSESYVTVIRSPKQSGWILKGLFQGWGRGGLEAADTFKNGFQPSKFEQKIGASQTLERFKFKGGAWNPFNYLKYVSRIMNSADIFFYQGLNEMRARELAVKLAKQDNKNAPNKEIIKKATKIIYGENNPWEQSLSDAKNEGWEGRDLKRRAYEILEQRRPEFIIKDANEAGSRGTFNYDPEGTLGALTDAINRMTDMVDVMGVKPIKFIIPFTRIIANVTNRYLDWSPIGLLRAAKGGIGYTSLGENKYHKYTPEERAKIWTKAITGTIAMSAVYALTDDEDGIFEITADGTGDLQKNFELQETGWRPYSIKIGDTWYEYKNTPLAIPFAIIGFIRDAEKYRGEKDLEAKFSIIMMGTLKYVMDMSFLQSLSSFFDTFSQQTPGSADNFFKKGAKGTERVVKSFLIPNAFTQVSRSIQEVMDLPIKRANSYGDQIIRDLPLLRDHLGNIYDALGDPVVPNQIERFIPLKPSPQSDQKLWDLIIENKAWIGRPRRASLKPNGESMTDEEYDQFALLSGQLTKKKLQQNYGRLSRMKDKSKVQDEINQIKTEARREARDKLYGSMFF